jgi:hypothetical protein
MQIEVDTFDDDARREAERASDCDLLDLVELFTQSGYVDLAEALLLVRAEKSKDMRFAGWLAHPYEMRNDVAKALVWAHKIFDAHSAGTLGCEQLTRC